MERFDIINHFIKKYNFVNYLEIGVFHGSCIENIIAEHIDGVDPGHEGVVHPKVNYPVTSDGFFELIQDHPEIKYDIIFIDGLHESTQVDKDISNSLKHSIDNGVIAMHDCNPPTQAHAQVPRNGQVEWNGDTYKSFLQSRINNPQYKHFVVNDDWGVGVILKNQGDTPISKEELQYGIDSWEYFDSNRTKLLNLISVDEFKDTYK
jgi:hypothetical protein